MTAFAFISRIRPQRSLRTHPCAVQSELAFHGNDVRDLRAWLDERRKSPWRRFAEGLFSALFPGSVRLIAPFLAAAGRLRKIPPLVWTMGSFLISVALYAHRLGWNLSAGFLILLAVHEGGHLLAARHHGVRTSWPLFIPYLGAVIDLKDRVVDPWKNAVIGLAGPVFGTAGALVTYALYKLSGIPCLAEIAFLALGMNLFNLIPIGELDAGKAMSALSRWIWIPGFAMMVTLAWWSRAPVAILACVFLLPSVIGLFRRKELTPLQPKISLARRLLICGVYFGLVAMSTCSGLCIFARDILPLMKSGTSDLLKKSHVRPQPLQQP